MLTCSRSQDVSVFMERVDAPAIREPHNSPTDIDTVMDSLALGRTYVHLQWPIYLSFSLEITLDAIIAVVMVMLLRQKRLNDYNILR